MPPSITSDSLVLTLKDAIVGSVRRDGPDLSARQLGVFLISYLEEGPHTVRGLAARLEISKPAVTRSLDRLEELGLARRMMDPRDRRSILVQRTLGGAELLADLRDILNESAKAQSSSGRSDRAGTRNASGR
jgi:DNA-binding MarR family transcriptional regulator